MLSIAAFQSGSELDIYIQYVHVSILLTIYKHTPTPRFTWERYACTNSGYQTAFSHPTHSGNMAELMAHCKEACTWQLALDTALPAGPSVFSGSSLNTPYLAWSAPSTFCHS